MPRDGLRGLDNWLTTPPWDRCPTRPCVCGDAEDNHTDEDNLTDDPQFLLNALRAIDKAIDKADAIQNIRQVLDTTLAVCGRKGCTCRKFEEQDADDYDYDEDD